MELEGWHHNHLIFASMFTGSLVHVSLPRKLFQIPHHSVDKTVQSYDMTLWLPERSSHDLNYRPLIIITCNTEVKISVNLTENKIRENSRAKFNSLA